jgi:hypothetical protein
VNLTQGEGDGVFEAEVGATLNFSGSYELEGVIQGEGTILLSGNLTGTNGVVSGGALTWIGGSIGGGSTLRVATNGVLVVSGANYHELHGVLTNAGTILLTNSALLRPYGDAGGGQLINLPGSLVDFGDDSSIYYYYGNEAVVNQGTVRKSGGGGISYITAPFYNSATLDVRSGTVNLTQGEGDGVFEAEVGATLNFSGSYELEGVIRGEGTILLIGSLTGTNGVVSGGALTWIGGSIGGGSTLRVATNGMLVVSGANYHELHGVLTNAGTILLTNATFLRCFGDSGAGRLINLPGALVDFQDDSWIYYYYGNEAVVNQGTVRKSGGSGISSIYPAFYNSGLLDVQTGVVSIYTGEGGGVFEAEAGATLNFFYNYTADGGAVFTGGGTNVISGGTFALNGTMTNSNLMQAGGNLAGNNAVISSFWKWTGGGVYGTVAVATNGVLVVSGASYHDLHGVLTNAGTIQLTDATCLRCFGDTGGGRLVNLPGALVNFQDDSWIYYYYGNEAVVNQGTVRKSGGSGISSIYPALYNSGLLDVQTGAVSIYTGEGGGVFEAEAGATLNFIYNYTADSGAVFMGGGTNVISGGTFTLNGVMTNSSLMLAGGNLAGNNAVISSFWKWTGGGVYGTVAVATNGMLVVSGASYRDLHGVLTNAGTIRLTDATYLRCVGDSGAGRLINLPGALVDFQDDSWIYYAGYGGEAVVNQGTVRKSGGSGISSIYPAFYNSGTVEAQNGTIQFNGSYAETSSANMLFSPGGPTPGSDYGQIHFSTTLPIAGKFTVSMRNGFRPNPGDSFSVLSYPSVTGDFSCMNGLDLGNGLQLAPRFGKTGLTLVAVAHATNALPSMSLSLTPSGTLVLWPQDFIGWQLEMTTNLTTPDWTPVTVSGTNNTIVPRTGSEAYFRLKSN